MSTEPIAPQKLRRVFIGIPVDRPAQRQINGLLKPFRKLPVDVHWVPEANRHMTLAFLGNIPVTGVDALVESFDQAYGQAARFHYRMTALSRFPGPRGRIVALVNEPDSALQHIFQITLDLVHKNGFEADRKRFRPHVTLGKIRKAYRVKERFYQPVDIRLDVSAVRLFQSTMTASGVVYTSLKDTRL